MKISQAAFDLIWNEESGGRAYYEGPPDRSCEWPGGASGVTIGGFYDCGYVTHDELRRDWGDKLTANALNDLEDIIGINGFPAKSHAAELRGGIRIPFDVAAQVLREREIPKWEAIVQRDLPNCDKLPADCFGALVSLTLNRGDHYRQPGSRYREMRLIRQDMIVQDFKSIPAWIRSMRRLWPAGGDLWNRREHEA